MSVESRMNAAVNWLVRHNVPLLGARWLEVRGRRSGQIRGTAVNPLSLNGRLYLVAPRGNTQWVRNLRVEHTCQVRGVRFRATELPVEQRPPVLAAYLDRWAWQVKQWLTAESDPRDHPVFELTPTN